MQQAYFGRREKKRVAAVAPCPFTVSGSGVGVVRRPVRKSGGLFWPVADGVTRSGGNQQQQCSTEVRVFFTQCTIANVAEVSQGPEGIGDNSIVQQS